MNIGLWLACCLSLAGQFLFTAPAPPPGTVTALKMKPEFVTAFNNVGVPAFTLDSKGILRPKAGYTIQYRKGASHLIVLPAGEGISTLKKGKGSKGLPGGATLNCIGCEDCGVVVLASGPAGTNYGCRGGCECNAMVNVPAEDVEAFQEGGVWRPI